MYKRLVVVLFTLLCVCACKKESSTATSNSSNTGGSAQAATNSVNWFVTIYDSLGYTEQDRSNVTVSLNGLGLSAVTNSLGTVTMTGVSAGNLQPVLSKNGYEYVPQSIAFNAAQALNLNTFIARNCPYKLTLTGSSLVNKDSITLNFFLNKSIPAGKNVKVAILAGDLVNTDVSNFKAYDYLYVSGGNTFFTNKNIAKLNNIATYLSNSISTGQNCYFVIVPVSYGVAYSSALSKNILVGDNLPVQGSPTATLQIIKNW
jgi:hypothetical protein